MAKVISKEDIENCQSWEAPLVDNPADYKEGEGRKRNPNLLTAEQIEQVQKQAYEEAYAVGLQEGVQAGKELVQQHLQQLNQLMSALQKPFEDLDHEVDEQFVTLTMSMVKQLVRRELKSDPGQVMAVVREAIAALPVSCRNVQLHLHPEDAALVQELYKISGDEQTWKIVDDPVITRGGCKVVSDTTQVDATMETRVAQLFASVFGGERQEDNHDD
jgi:flagellar assembly protein FliH